MIELETIADADILGPWRITDTVFRDRKNLFCLAPNREHHIGTIISGSTSQLNRFEQNLQIIKNAPDMFLQLQTIQRELKAIQQHADHLGDLSQYIDGLIGRTKSPFIEG